MINSFMVKGWPNVMSSTRGMLQTFSWMELTGGPGDHSVGLVLALPLMR